MSTIKNAVIGVMASLVAATTAHAAIVVSYEGEAPGVQNTTATFSYSAVETFEGFATGTSAVPRTQTFISGVNPATTITMAYSGTGGVQINAADQYGGAGGNGKYIAAFSSTPYTLDLTATNLAGGINYFGYWLSALDAGNQVKLYGNSNQLLLTFNPQDVLNVVTKKLNSGEYYGNPNNPFKNANSGEPYIFLNFFDTTGTFSKIVFTETPASGGYESDNHTVGNYLTMGQGTIIPLINSTPGPVPEPTMWAMMLAGFAMIGLGARRRPNVSFAYAKSRAPSFG